MKVRRWKATATKFVEQDYPNFPILVAVTFTFSQINPLLNLAMNLLLVRPGSGKTML